MTIVFIILAAPVITVEDLLVISIVANCIIVRRSFIWVILRVTADLSLSLAALAGFNAGFSVITFTLNITRKT